MADSLQQLKERLSRIADLDKVARLLSWDQQTMMPPAGSGHRAVQQGVLAGLRHELLIDEETGRLLDAVGPQVDSLDPDSDDACLVRLARRDYEKARRVPTELRAEIARASSEARPVWVKARQASDFELFLPVLERNIELRRRYVDCFDGVEERYDILLDDFEPETTTAEVRAVFDEVKPELLALIAALRDRDADTAFLQGPFPVEQQEALSNEVIELFGMRPETWRLDPTVHPFASGAGVDDVRLTTAYHEDSLKSLFSTMHEYGHGLYNHQLPRELERLPTGGPCSLGIHESQSRMWENLVGRSRPFWRFFYPRVQTAFPKVLGEVELERFLPGVNRVRPGLIRIQADEVSYGMHIILRFELEQDIVNDRVELRKVPAVWTERMGEYLGVEVPDDAHGVLQDTHWASGLIGYFPTYLLGTIMSVQIWEAAAQDVPGLEEGFERGEFEPLRSWLGKHVHALGRRFPPQETLQRVTGAAIDPKPYVAYLKAKYGAGIAA